MNLSRCVGDPSAPLRGAPPRAQGFPECRTPCRGGSGRAVIVPELRGRGRSGHFRKYLLREALPAIVAGAGPAGLALGQGALWVTGLPRARGQEGAGRISRVGPVLQALPAWPRAGRASTEEEAGAAVGAVRGAGARGGGSARRPLALP